MRSFGVLLFIGLVGSVALFCVTRTTTADGARLGVMLAKTNAKIRTVECDKNIPIGIRGATFKCRVYMRSGDNGELTLRMERSGKILVVSAEDTPRVKKTTDPWGD